MELTSMTCVEKVIIYNIKSECRIFHPIRESKCCWKHSNLFVWSAVWDITTKLI